MSLLFYEVRKITFLNMKLEDFFKSTLTRECKRIKKKIFVNELVRNCYTFTSPLERRFVDISLMRIGDSSFQSSGVIAINCSTTFGQNALYS